MKECKIIRTIDIALSFFLILVLLPLFLIISIMLFLTGENKIFFLQNRVGKDNKTIKIIKFVTMLKNSPYVGTKTITIKNDKRILPLGYFLRISKINELPQLVNILKGDMSFVGPRPLTEENFNFYSSRVRREIVKIRPGLTGVSSIIFRNEENILNKKNNINFYKNEISSYKGNLELWFVKNLNFFNYFKILILTFVVVILPNSKLIFQTFDSIPKLPPKLKDVI